MDKEEVRKVEAITQMDHRIPLPLKSVNCCFKEYVTGKKLTCWGRECNHIAKEQQEQKDWTDCNLKKNEEGSSFWERTEVESYDGGREGRGGMTRNLGVTSVKDCRRQQFDY